MSLRRRVRLAQKEYPCSHTIKTGEPCHVWKERIKQPLTFPNNRVTFNHIPDMSDFYENTEYNHDLIRDRNIKYPDIVDKYFMTKEFLNSCIKGTNDHATRRNDNNYDHIRLLSRGRLEIKCYWAIELALQLWNRTVDEFFSDDAIIGLPQISRIMTQRRFEEIRRNFCMNENGEDPNDPNYDRHSDWNGGIEILLTNSRAATDMDVHFKVIDEARTLDTSTRNPDSTMVSCKPDRKGVDVNTVCVQLSELKGYTIGAKVYQKDHMVEEDVKVDDSEGDTDNLVNQLVRQTQADHCVFVQDKKFNSMFVHGTLAPALNVEFMGPIMPNRQHLPTSKLTKNGKVIKYGYFASPQWQRRVKAMERGDFIQFYCDNINLTVLKDKGKDPVYLLDTCCNWRKWMQMHLKGKPYIVPAVVALYRRSKGYCDTANQRRAAFGIERRSVRKYRNTFMGLAELLIFVNSAILYGDIHDLKIFNSKALRTEWVLHVVKLAIASTPTIRTLKPRRKTVRGIENSILCRSGDHKLVKYDNSAPKKQIECYYCRKVLRKVSYTTFKCSLCNVHGNPVGFCKKRGKDVRHRFSNCFDLFELHQ